MSKPSLGLVVYGDSDEDSDDGVASSATPVPLPQKPPTDLAQSSVPNTNASASIHPPPITHCPWSACYDESSGFTYYWNQHTNAVTWEAPPEYLLALKLAQQQLNSGSTEVSAEEWQLYQQALAEKQHAKLLSKHPAIKMPNKTTDTLKAVATNGKPVKRGFVPSDDEDIKIELITSYSNADSESNDESESPVKATPLQPPPAPQPKVAKVPAKKKVKVETVEYGPSLPPNQSYTLPIGPELPPPSEESTKDKNEDRKAVNEDTDDETSLLQQLKDKAKLLEKLGGELPKDLKKIIKEESRGSSPKNIDEDSRGSRTIDTNIDDLLEEIEKKELPKIKNKVKIDMFGDDTSFMKEEAAKLTDPGDMTPPLTSEVKSLFPSAKNIEETPKCLFPSAENIQENGMVLEIKSKPPSPSVTEKKGVNLYIMNASEKIGNAPRKKLRISNSVLPEKTRSEPVYTTKYSHFIDGFSSERTGLGFSKEETDESSPKNTISYGNGLTFTKGETLNEEKKDEALDDMTDLIEMKLKHLNELQPSPVAPIQEMLVQMQTLGSAFRAGALSVTYWRAWSQRAAQSLEALECSAAPPLWRCRFVRSEGRYLYQRESDGFEQWEYPAEISTDMEICTTPPHPGIEVKEIAPPLPTEKPRSPPPAPAWPDPPPPGTEPAPAEPPPIPKQDDELLSFYNDIAELEKQSSPPPAPPAPPRISQPSPEGDSDRRERESKREREKKEVKVKKKSKVKISSSMGVKHKTVSTLVAKWQQVAEEINSD